MLCCWGVDRLPLSPASVTQKSRCIHDKPDATSGTIRSRKRAGGCRVKLRDFVKSDKTLLDPGVWSDKRMPKTGGKFPLSKARNFRVGAPGWRWRVLQYEIGAAHYRVLIMYHYAKQNYTAYVGAATGLDLLILGALENHSTHRGWHVHAACKLPSSADSGRLRYQSMRRTGAGAAKNTLLAFPQDDRAAFEIAARYFKLPPLPSDGAVQVPMSFPSEGVS